MFQDVTIAQVAQESGRQYKQVAKLVAEYTRVTGTKFEGDGSRKQIPREVADVLVAVLAKVGPKGRLSYQAAIEDAQIGADRARILAQPADILRTIRAVELSLDALDRLLNSGQLQRTDLELTKDQLARITRRLRHLLAECGGLTLNGGVSPYMQVELLHVVHELASLFTRVTLFDATLSALRTTWQEHDDAAYTKFKAFVAHAQAQPPFILSTSQTEVSNHVNAPEVPGDATEISISEVLDGETQVGFPSLHNDTQIFLDSWCNRYPDLNSTLFKGDEQPPAPSPWECPNRWILLIGYNTTLLKTF